MKGLMAGSRHRGFVRVFMTLFGELMAGASDISAQTLPGSKGFQKLGVISPKLQNPKL